MMRSAAARALVVAVVAAAAGGCRRSVPAAGFWYESGRFALAGGDASALGGPLTPDELQTIEHLSREEVVRAFAGLRLEITDRRDAPWKVAVRPDTAGRTALPNAAGASVALAPLGGWGVVDFDVLADLAVQFAPAGADRAAVLSAIGRGIGRAAVHELAHQILGPRLIHNSADPDSYEFPTADRASQYYGAVHWTTAWPSLVRRFGTTGPPPRG